MYRRVSVEIDGDRPLRCYGPPELAIHVGDSCILEVDRVPEFGRVVGLEEMGGDIRPGRGVPKLLRQATLQDRAKADENALRSRMARETCVAKAAGLGLQMHLVRIRFSFDRRVLHILFTAEQNIDARALINELAAELKTRVEMKQIGVRDEAGIIGGIGPCGRTLCCCTWLRHFESINVKMAKAQRVSLNPTSMSGSCGRLKCCMRYEYDVYRDLTRGLPRNGSVVECPDGRGMVLGTNILAQRVKVQLDDERIVEYAAGEVKEERTNPGKGGRMMDENPGHKRTESGAAGEARARRIRRDKP